MALLGIFGTSCHPFPTNCLHIKVMRNETPLMWGGLVYGFLGFEYILIVSYAYK